MREVPSCTAELPGQSFVSCSLSSLQETSLLLSGVKSIPLMYAALCYMHRSVGPPPPATWHEYSVVTMIHWICDVRNKDRIDSNTLAKKLKINSIAEALRGRRLRWYDHVQRNDGWLRRCTEIVVDGRRGRGRSRRTWSDCTKEDLRCRRLEGTNVEDRNAWKKAVSNATRLTP